MENLIFFARIVSIASFLLVAFIGWRLLVYRPTRRAGRVFHWLGIFALAGGAAWPTIDHHEPVAVRTFEAPRLEASSPAHEPSKPAYWASSIGATYHRPTCRYAGSVKHSLTYETEADAQAAGRRPCKYCLAETVSMK